MRKPVDPIRIRISLREPSSESNEKLSPRGAFWSPLLRQENFAERSLPSLEYQLCSNFGTRLQGNLRRHLTKSLDSAEAAIYGDTIRNITSAYDHFLHFRGKFREEGFPPFPSDPTSKLAELRQEIFREVPELRSTIYKLTLLSQVVFETRIESYSSLDLSVIPSSIETLSKVFDANFETLKVFLDVFVPESFENVFNSDFAALMNYDITIPTSMRSAFELQDSSATPPSPVSVTSDPQPSKEQKRAAFLWKLANGSLLAPVILFLFVGFWGLKELNSYRNMQYEVLQPILQHHIQLLKEDRERLSEANDLIQSLLSANPNKPHAPAKKDPNSMP